MSHRLAKPGGDSLENFAAGHVDDAVSRWHLVHAWFSLLALHCCSDNMNRGMQRSVYRAFVCYFQQSLPLLRAQVAIDANFARNDFQRAAALGAVFAILLVTALVF